VGSDAGGAGEVGDQFIAGNLPGSLETDGLPTASEEWAKFPEAECGGELGVVAQPGMRVERQVRTVNGEVVLDQRTEQFVGLARPRMRWRPEQAVMDDQQGPPSPRWRVSTVARLAFHARGDARDRAGVLDLQAIDGAVVVANRSGAQELVGVFDKGGQRGAWHVRMKAEPAKREKLFLHAY